MAHAPGPSINVLIIDRDATARRSTCQTLTDAGYNCVEAIGAEDARKRLDGDADIVAALYDLEGMKSESGHYLLDTLANDFPKVAVVVTTAVDEASTAALAFEIGAHGYLVKPFTANEILITLSSALRRRQLEVDQHDQTRRLEETVARLRTLHSVLAGLENTAPDSSIDTETDTIERLSRALSLHGDETSMHLERMSRFSALLAEAVGFTDCPVQQVRLASALHDVGKIGIPDNILLKPGPLSATEHAAMQHHSQIGYQLMAGSTSALLRMGAEIALGHHEWWDGSGYPRGLQREEIPPEARIAAVADVFDALTSDRVYRRAIPVDAAVETMLKLRGRQFEPALLDAFVGSLEEVSAIRAAYPEQNTGPPIRVLVVDDHQIFVQSLVRLLGAQPAITVVGTATTAAEGERAAVARQPDVVLMDFELPDHDGATATEAIKALAPEVQVVMLTGRTDQHALVRAISAGCAGFVSKTEGIDKLIEAIRSAHEGEVFAPIIGLPSLLAQLRPTSRGLGSDLGLRELEVLRLMAVGVPNKALARQLHLSLNTVRNHVQHILYKLGAHSKLEAVATAVREGIIQRYESAADS